MNVVKDLGTRLKMIRIYSEIKQKDLADKLNVPASLLSLYEQGKREPSITFLNTFCEHFDMSLSQLFAYQTSEEKDNKNSQYQNIINSLQKFLSEVEKDKLNLINA
jgi:transcriptional regulator with XRE-family HTH domain